MFKNITFRVSYSDHAALSDFAESKNMTTSEALRELIRTIGKQKTFEARLTDFMKKIESELGNNNSDMLTKIYGETLNINRGLAVVVNRNGNNEWEDMNKLKKAISLLSGANPHTAQQIKNLFESKGV